jgi:LPXTG-motif cell wall-anchored protein
MNGPITETANWEQSTSLWLILLIAAIIFALIAFLIAWRRRKDEKKPTESTVKKRHAR